ncbi:radical SAM protein [Intestinibacter bartlettii]|uniref:radical SAM protein n=1 Tax=Intestinibacter bartlettii TaxID=261299 RepID=UPI00290E44D1|nr:radical SAM protein [Intestinibacter bartlettii]MDU6472992.1 radical SAM protein [Intestinibacter bartlettii]
MKQKLIEPRLTEYLHRKASRTKTPISGTFELSPLCNMDCKMCYIKMSKEKQESIARLRTKEEWIELAQKAKEKGMLFLLLTGGEPFLVKDFKELYIELHKMGFCISINSNGTMIDEDVIEWLKHYPPMRINMTLYGASNETYGRLCNNPKGFTQVTKAISLLKENNIQVKLNCSVTPYNKDNLKQMMDFAQEHDLVIQATSYMFPPLRKDETKIGQNDRFNAEDAALYGAYISAYSNGFDRFKDYIESGQLALYDADDDCGVVEGDHMRCRAGITSFWMTWEGKMLPCGMIPDEGKDPWEVGFDEAWENAKNIVSDITLPVKCAGCGKKDECRACAAMVYTETGTYDKVPQYRCEMTKNYPKACKKVLKELEQQL